MYDLYSQNKAIRNKVQRFNAKMERLVKEVGAMAENIAAFNKPVFEAGTANGTFKHQ